MSVTSTRTPRVDRCFGTTMRKKTPWPFNLLGVDQLQSVLGETFCPWQENTQFPLRHSALPGGKIQPLAPSPPYLTWVLLALLRPCPRAVTRSAKSGCGGACPSVLLCFITNSPLHHRIIFAPTSPSPSQLQMPWVGPAHNFCWNRGQLPVLHWQYFPVKAWFRCKVNKRYNDGKEKKRSRTTCFPDLLRD